MSQKEVWRSMEQKKIKPKLQKPIKRLYGQNKCYIRKEGAESQMFELNDGLKQGGVLSPPLSIIIMDDVIKVVK